MIKAQSKRLYSDVDFLCKIRPFRNYRNIESLERVCNYLKDQLRPFAYPVEELSWFASGQEYKNLIFSYAKDKKKRLIIGAHYDVCGDQPGADDNASAVAGLLETARLLMENQPDLDYGIDLVAYCLEEPPFFDSEYMGSFIHARSLREKNVDVIGMICYEMIGYFSDEPGSQTYPDSDLAKQYPSVADFIAVVGISEFSSFNAHFYKHMQADSKVKVELVNFPFRQGLAGLSDQRNYWHFDYPALMINDTSFIRNPNYHEVSDTIDTLDFDKMTEVVNSCYRAILQMDRSF